LLIYPSYFLKHFKNMNRLTLFCISIILPAFFININAQQGILTGLVQEVNQKGILSPLPFVNIYWLGTQKGTVTNEKGEFTIERKAGNERIVVSYVGYKNDTIFIEPGKTKIDIVLSNSVLLNEVIVKSGLEGAYISKLQPMKTEIITERGLQQLACCNLSESFQNNATVDVGFTDAVSGARQIQMLGLAGIYSQVMTENMPAIRGMASTYGLDYIPGPWMEAIQISKGTASVINGYESTTGQINVEYKKPERTEKLYLNLYGNSEQRMEGNLTASAKVSNKIHTMIMAHASALEHKSDMNKDGFLDMPTGNRINLINRWVYDGDKQECIQFLINGIQETRHGGQSTFYEANGGQNQDYYGIGIKTKRIHSYFKAGFPILSRPLTSIGFQFSGTYHEQDTYFGKNIYTGKETGFYSNAIYQSYIGNTNHLISTGVSYMSDKYNEVYNDSLFSRTEHIPGIFAQYTYKYLEKMDFVFGFRADNNSRYGVFLTPRTHFKYALNNLTTLRASAGKGYRSPLLISENISYLASSRVLIFHSDLRAEEAWNYGASIIRDFHWGNHKEATISFDYFRTEFINQIVIDPEKDIHQVNFYNLEGKSRSNSYQANINITPLKGATVTAAFRYNDVKSDINNTFLEKPLVIKHKGLLTLSYLTKYDKWQFDFTMQYNGKSRLPSTAGNPEAYKRKDYSDDYIMLYSQITRRFKNIDIYLGGENLTDFTQTNPIIASDEPFGKYFDSSMVWGPLSGRMFYAGLRFTIK